MQKTFNGGADPSGARNVLGPATRTDNVRVAYDAELARDANTPPADAASSREQGRQHEIWRAVESRTTETHDWN
jgi:hypothetical protein